MTQDDFDKAYGNYLEQQTSDYERSKDSEQKEKDRNLVKQKIELQKQELTVKQQGQNTQQVLVYGGLTIGALLVIVIAAYLFTKQHKNRSKHRE